MKCFAYLTPYEKEKILFRRFDIGNEIGTLLLDEDNIFYSWYSEYFEFLMENYKYYNINKDDIILIEVVIYYYFEKKDSNRTDVMDNKIFDLIKKSNPHAMYNLASFYYDKTEYDKYHEQLYAMNYYRSFDTYAKIIADEEKDINKALIILKKSISNGYIEHIRIYFEIFMLNNEFEDIVTKPNLKSELMFIIINFLNNIILGELDFLFDLGYMRNVLIKHYNFEYEFKNNIDTYLKEIINYLIIFMKGNDDENRNKINSYFIPDDFARMYTIYGHLCYLGLRGIMDKNYNETLNKYNYLLKNDEGCFTDIVYLYHIYMIKIK